MLLGAGFVFSALAQNIILLVIRLSAYLKERPLGEPIAVITYPKSIMLTLIITKSITYSLGLFVTV